MIFIKSHLLWVVIFATTLNFQCFALTPVDPATLEQDMKSFRGHMRLYRKCWRGQCSDLEKKAAAQAALKDGAIIVGSLVVIGGTIAGTVIFGPKVWNKIKKLNEGQKPQQEPTPPLSQSKIASVEWLKKNIKESAGHAWIEISGTSQAIKAMSDGNTIKIIFSDEIPNPPALLSNISPVLAQAIEQLQQEGKTIRILMPSGQLAHYFKEYDSNNKVWREITQPVSRGMEPTSLEKDINFIMAMIKESKELQRNVFVLPKTDKIVTVWYAGNTIMISFSGVAPYKTLSDISPAFEQAIALLRKQGKDVKFNSDAD